MRHVSCGRSRRTGTNINNGIAAEEDAADDALPTSAVLEQDVHAPIELISRSYDIAAIMQTHELSRISR